MPEWLTVKEAASYLKVSRSTIFRRIKEGKLKPYKSGKITRILKDDLDRLFKEK
jgi:excisionase family DNA binding protein